MERLLPLFVLAALLYGCDDSPCLAEADSCPDGCYEVRAVQKKPTCETGRVVACFDTGPVVMTDDIGCMTRLSDGHVFTLSSGTLAGLLRGTDEWRNCTTDESGDLGRVCR